MRDDCLPCVTVFCDFQNPDVIVKKILDCENLPEAFPVDATAKCYPWLIDTKYYQANVNICPVQDGEILSERVQQSTEGLILYFDAKDMSSFEKTKKWVDNMINLSPEVLLLVCDSFKETSSGGVERNTAVEWCLHNGFELIELHHDEALEEQDYDIIPEKQGFDRIVEALHTHTWSNLDLKSPKQKTTNKHEPDLEEANDEFCKLFSQLQGMKESLQSLPSKERKAHAEQVVTTFWKAIGGDEQEIEDIFDDDDDVAS